jgi:hypothetical protein
MVNHTPEVLPPQRNMPELTGITEKAGPQSQRGIRTDRGITHKFPLGPCPPLSLCL